MSIATSIAAYEDFLRQELGAEVVEEGLARKRKEMAASPFAFLRATYWRWAETVQEIAPELMEAPQVLAVGDIHLENFGTWRDADGRLVWGVNDFDEAAEMPYALDLLRLATSTLLACGAARKTGMVPPDIADVAARLLGGYRDGLRQPRPFVLDRGFGWLRTAVMVPETERDAFWAKLAEKREKFEKRPEAKRPPLWPRYRDTLLAALPPGAAAPCLWYRSAGLGSLGRPRWVAEADWCGEVVLREAKGVVPSAWTRLPGRGSRAIRCVEAATGRFRAPDPWYRVVDGVAVRRLSPNNRKLNASKGPVAAEEDEAAGVGLDDLLTPEMLDAMGRELAAMHLGRRDAGGEITRDLAHRKDGWLGRLATKAAAAVQADFTALPGG